MAKYPGMEDCSPQPLVAHRRPSGSVLTGFEKTIDGWLEGDEGRSRQQRDTAKRVFDRLVTEEGFTGSYSQVQRYVKLWQARNRAEGEGFAELVWPARTVQVDFGQAETIIAGIRQVLHVLVVTSRSRTCASPRFTAAKPANACATGCARSSSTPGRAEAPGVRQRDRGRAAQREDIVESWLFSTFKLHYRCEARYCHPYSEYEKGNVENSVGFLRRNLMVPEPEAASLQALNRTCWRAVTCWPEPCPGARARASPNCSSRTSPRAWHFPG